MATEFETSGSVRVEVEQSSLRDARQDIEQTMGSVTVDAEATAPQSAGRADGGTSSLALAGGANALDELSDQTEYLEDILDEIEKQGASGEGGGGGGGGVVQQGLALQGVRSLGVGGALTGAAGAIGTGGALAGAGIAGIGVGGWGLSDIATGGEGFSEIGDLGEQFSEQFPDIGEDIENLFTENPFADMGRATRDLLEGDFELTAPDWLGDLNLDIPSAPDWVGNLALDIPSAPDWLGDLALDLPSAPDWLGDLELDIPDAPDWLGDLEITVPDWLMPGDGDGDPLDPPSGNPDDGPDTRGTGERIYGEGDSGDSGLFTGGGGDTPTAAQAMAYDSDEDVRTNRAAERRSNGTNVDAQVRNDIQANLDFSNANELQNFLQNPQRFIERNLDIEGL